MLLNFHGFVRSTGHRHVILFFACLIFAVGLDREIILTAKFSRSMVYLMITANKHWIVMVKKDSEDQPGFEPGLLNSSQMLLSTEPLELWH